MLVGSPRSVSVQVAEGVAEEVPDPGQVPEGHGERSRLQLPFKLGGTENISILAVNVLTVNFWLLSGPSPSI